MSLLGTFLTVCVATAGVWSLWWFLPITVGWALAVPFAVFTSRVELGKKLMSWHLLMIPEEVEPPTVLQYKRRVQKSLSAIALEKASAN